MLRHFEKPANLLLAVSSWLGSYFSPELTMVRGMPVSVSTELTNNCNLKCPGCFIGSGMMKRQHGFMDIGLFRRIIAELRPFLYNINLYFQGESMLHPLFIAFVESCRGMHSVVSTNGHFLSSVDADRLVRSGLSHLIVSVDGADQESYSAYRINGDLERVTEGLRLITEAMTRNKSKMKLEIQMLVNRYNEQHIPKIRIMAEKLKATLSLKSMQIIKKENIGLWMPANKKFRRYEMIDGEYVIKNRMANSCARLWFNPVITWDGKVLPCCFDKDAEYIMGDLNQDSFREIWNGPRYRVFRKALLKDRSMIEICRNCSSGLKGVKH